MGDNSSSRLARRRRKRPPYFHGGPAGVRFGHLPDDAFRNRLLASMRAVNMDGREVGRRAERSLGHPAQANPAEFLSAFIPLASQRRQKAAILACAPNYGRNLKAPRAREMRACTWKLAPAADAFSAMYGRPSPYCEPLKKFLAMQRLEQLYHQGVLVTAQGPRPSR